MNFDIVTIRVDSPAIDIPVYKEIICAAAPYFRCAFEGHSKEADEGVIRLSDVSEKTFRIFLQWAHSPNHIGLGSMTEFASDDLPMEDGGCCGRSSTIDKSRVSKSCRYKRPPIFDETAADCQPVFDESKMTKLYWENEEWLATRKTTLMSYLRLYIFADRYCVHQLRDDIISAVIGEALVWGWWPDPDSELVNLAYNSLPSDCQFIRLLVITTVYTWLPGGDFLSKAQSLVEWNQDFCSQVIVAMAQRSEYQRSGGRRGIPLEIENYIHNSCALHEHIDLEMGACRKRLTNYRQVFTNITAACTKELS